MNRDVVVAWAATVTLAALVLAPVLAPRGWDDFPLSPYPMFSRGDLGTIVPLDHVLLVGRDGARRPAAPALVGTPEVMVAMKVIAGAVGRGEAGALCVRVASAATDPDVEAVEVVTSTFDTRRYFAGAAHGPEAFAATRAPVARTVHARCAVPARRGAPGASP